MVGQCPHSSHKHTQEAIGRRKAGMEEQRRESGEDHPIRDPKATRQSAPAAGGEAHATGQYAHDLDADEWPSDSALVSCLRVD